MKKILLASTILVGTAGFAAAENANFTFSGAAYVGMAYNIDTEVFTPVVNSSATLSMMTTTDMGLEAGASISIRSDRRGMETDHTDAAFGTVTNNGADVNGDAAIYISSDFGRLDVEYDSGDQETTVGYSDVGVTANVSGFTADVNFEYNNDATNDIDWKAEVGYKTGPYSVGVWAEDHTVADDIDFGASAAYDLGGGVAIEGAAIYDKTLDQAVVTLGVSMAF